MIYLDNSATTKMLPEAVEASAYYMATEYYNPSSMYKQAVSVDNKMCTCKSRLASYLKAGCEEVYFTSGATESNNIAIMGTVNALRKGNYKFITTAFEHPSVYAVFMQLQAMGHDVVFLDVNEFGQISASQLSNEITENTALVSIMHVNNEIGTIADLLEIRNIIRRKNPCTLFHSDGVQAFCKLPVTTQAVDMYSISAHKFHGPKGVGALMVRKGVKNRGGQLGGGQQNGFRSGTTNTPGIAGMEVAATILQANLQKNINHMYECKKRLYTNLCSIDDVFLNGPDVMCSAPHILNMSFMGVRGEVLLHSLEQKGILVATGSACSSHKKGKNRVLDAIGVTGIRQEGAVRFSVCPFSTLAEMDLAADEIENCVFELRKFKRK